VELKIVFVRPRQGRATRFDLGRANHRLSTLVDRPDLVDNASICKREGGSEDDLPMQEVGRDSRDH